jgi:hypothetical protein
VAESSICPNCDAAVLASAFCRRSGANLQDRFTSPAASSTSEDTGSVSLGFVVGIAVSRKPRTRSAWTNKT